MNRPAATAIAALDRLLADRPDRVDGHFSAATRHLAAYRDELIFIWRRTASETDRRRLGRVNAVLSVVLGGQYPVGEVPWPSIAQARAELADVAQET